MVPKIAMPQPPMNVMRVQCGKWLLNINLPALIGLVIMPLYSSGHSTWTRSEIEKGSNLGGKVAPVRVDCLDWQDWPYDPWQNDF